MVFHLQQNRFCEGFVQTVGGYKIEIAVDATFGTKRDVKIKRSHNIGFN